MANTKPMRVPGKPTQTRPFSSFQPTLPGGMSPFPSVSATSRPRVVTVVMAPLEPPPMRPRFVDDDRPAPGRGDAIRRYRRVAYGVLGTCGLLLIVAGASAARRHTEKNTPEPATTALSSPIPAEPMATQSGASGPPSLDAAATAVMPGKSHSRAHRAPARTVTQERTTTSTAAFDKDAAAQSLATASVAAAACKPPHTTIQSRVAVTFEPDGKVSRAVVLDPRWAGTAVGRCLTSDLRRATVPPFHGKSHTVTTVLAP